MRPVLVTPPPRSAQWTTLFGLLIVSACSGQQSPSQDAGASADASGPLGSQDFEGRCAAAGVIRCVGFDQAADIAGTFGDNTGVLPGGDHVPELDNSVKSSGAGSLRFTVSSAEANSGGSYWANFSPDLMTQFDSGQELYVQWRQRFDAPFVAMDLSDHGGGGWKQIIIGAGDKPGCTKSMALSVDNGGFCASSCTALETNVQNIGFRGFPTMYNSCTGSSSTQNGSQPGGTSAYDPFNEPFGAYDFKLQNAMPAPYCLYSQGPTKSYFPPQGNCFGYVANEWMTFKVHIVIGTKTRDYFKDSHVDLWVAREGMPAQKVINWGPYDLAAGDQGLKFGKVWLLPYNTNKTSDNTSIPPAHTWYDELIVSSRDIADPL